MENRGGNRPTAPQNNPANVSGTGGAGQSGNYSGFAYGMNQQINNQIREGDAAVKSTGASSSSRPASALPSATPLTEETGLPGQPITDGVPIGGGANSLNLPPAETDNPDMQLIINSLPVLEMWAAQPGTTQSTKEYVQYLRTIIP
jgi:hypothetical protein